MKGGLDEVSLPNFVAAARGALERSGATLADISYLCGIHMKRSMHDAIVDELGGPRAAYLDDTGHMSGVDSLLALDRAGARRRARRGRPRPAARGRHGLHVGGGGRPMVIEDLVGQELVSPWRDDRAGADRRVRARDRRRAVDPHRPRASRRRAVRDDDRARLPDALARRADVRRGAAGARRLRDDAELRPQPCPLHLAGARRAPASAAAFGSRTWRMSRSGKQARVAATIELEGQEKPACVAEALFRFSGLKT